jgi:hypothetical protein
MNQRERGWIRAALTLVGGTAAGAVAAAIVVQVTKNRAAPSAAIAPVATSGGLQGAAETVHALFSRGKAKEGPVTGTHAVDHQRDHHLAILRHRDSARLPEWAQKTSDAIRKGLVVTQSQGQFEIIDIDCRSNSCLATLEWPSYDVAYRQWALVVGHPYGIPCGASVYLDEPSDRSAKYQGIILFGCASSNPGALQ